MNGIRNLIDTYTVKTLMMIFSGKYPREHVAVVRPYSSKMGEKCESPDN